MMNTVNLIGRITKDLELRQTQTGTAYVKFNVAVDRDYNKNGERETDFIPCTAWGKTAEHVSKYYTKGAKIALVGRCETSTYTDNAGQNRFEMHINVQNTYFVEKKTAQQPAPAAQQNYAPVQPTPAPAPAPAQQPQQNYAPQQPAPINEGYVQQAPQNIENMDFGDF